jgi:hypothetical protein
MPSNPIITLTPSVRNLGVIFDSTPSMSGHTSSASKSCFFSIRGLRGIRNRPTLDHTTAHMIATPLIQSKLDYCNRLFLNLPQSPHIRLQFILISSARAVSKLHKFCHINPLFKSLHWLKIQQRRPKSNVEHRLSPTKLFSLVDLLSP